MREIAKFIPLREIIGDALSLSPDEPWSTPCRSLACRAALTLAAVAAGFAAIAGTSTKASAADMAMKASQPPVYQWSGCYAGLNVGGGASGSDFTTTVDPGTHLVGADPAVVSANGSGSHGGDGPLAGGQAGCNLQSGTLVFGVEGDLDYFHSNPFFENGTMTLSDGATPFLVKQSLTTSYLATVRPRIGIAADRNLAYLTAGAAFTRVSYTETYSDGAAPQGSGIATASKSLAGWVAGAGWEYALADRWTFRAEYLYAGFPKVNALGAITDAGGGTNPLHGSADLTVQLVRAGVNFRF
jgi:outer membrane immunogenic protein